LSELENLSVGPGFLCAELVAGETENAQPIRFIVKGTQTCVLTGEASTAGYVDDEAELPFELGQPNRLAGDRCRLEIVQTGHGFSSCLGSTSM
jgi:hypothetical protein